MFIQNIVVLCLALWTWPPAVVGAPIVLATYGPSEVPSNFWTQKQRPQHRCHCGGHWATVVEHYPSAAVTREHYASAAVTRELQYPLTAVTVQADPWSTVDNWTGRRHERPAADTEQADPWSAVDNWTGSHHEHPAAVDHRAMDETISATAYDHFYDEAEGEEIDDDNISIHSFLPIILIAMFLLVYPILCCSCKSRKQNGTFYLQTSNCQCTAKYIRCI